MKKVFRNHREVCHIWAQQNQSEGRASRIFFDGVSIYSYGRHFEMARFVRPDLVFITNQGYSVSTSKHLSYMRQAVSHIKSFTVPSFSDHVANVQYFLSEMEMAGKAAVKAVKRGDYYIATMRGHSNALGSYVEIFKKDIPIELRGKARAQIAVIAKGNYAAILERCKGIVKQEREAAKIARIEKEREMALRIERWKAGESVNIHTDTPLLRVKNDTIETSQGARVPLNAAVKMFEMLKAGEPVHGVPLGNYTVTGFDGSILTVGCHKIPMAEMERMYKQIAA